MGAWRQQTNKAKTPFVSNTSRRRRFMTKFDRHFTSWLAGIHFGC